MHADVPKPDALVKAGGQKGVRITKGDAEQALAVGLFFDEFEGKAGVNFVGDHRVYCHIIKLRGSAKII